MTKEEEQLYQDWVYGDFWPKYPGDYGPKGSRAKLLKYVKRKKPTEEERLEIILALDAQKREARERKARGEWIKWPHASTWYNEERYLDEIESAMEAKQSLALDKCKVDGCGNDVHGPRFPYCTEHLAVTTDPWKQKRKEMLVKLGLMPMAKESQHEWAMRCKDYLMNAVRTGKVSMFRDMADD